MSHLSPKQNEYSVYIHTNKRNGKKYIGITKQNPERRWQKGFGYAGTYFWNAIQKYGWEGFTHEVVASGLTKEIACSMEVALIAMHGTNERERGYNISGGGETCDLLVGKTGVEHPNHQRVKMIDKETGEIIRIFGAQEEAARVMGFKRRGITKACQGIYKTYMGYIWEYADKKVEKPEHPGEGNYEHTKIQKAVIVTDKDGAEYCFESVKEAALKLGVGKNSAWRYLKKNYNDRNGRRWRYA